MTPESVSRNEWDNETNQREPEQPTPVMETSGSFFSYSSFDEPRLSISQDVDSHVTVETDNLNLNTYQTNVSPHDRMRLHEPEYIAPVTFEFADSSWKYVLIFVLNILLLPILVPLSKILGRSTGIRFKNPNYRRNSVS